MVEMYSWKDYNINEIAAIRYMFCCNILSGFTLHFEPGVVNKN